MRINTKTSKIELLKHESETLVRAMVVSKTLSKHADGDVEAFAKKVSEAIGELRTALADQGNEASAAPY